MDLEIDDVIIETKPVIFFTIQRNFSNYDNLKKVDLSSLSKYERT